MHSPTMVVTVAQSDVYDGIIAELYLSIKFKLYLFGSIGNKGPDSCPEKRLLCHSR